MTVNHTVKVHPSSAQLPREEQLAWKIAEVAADPVEVSAEVTDMVINRVLDNASVAMASVNRAPIVSARDQALRHRPAEGARLSLIHI